MRRYSVKVIQERICYERRGEQHQKPTTLSLESSGVNPKHHCCRKTSQNNPGKCRSLPVRNMKAHVNSF